MFQSAPPAKGATGDPGPRLPGQGFQSAPPAKGATIFFCPPFFSVDSFNPRPPRRGRPGPAETRKKRKCFNPRPPRRGRPQLFFLIFFCRQFQSAPPAKGATVGLGLPGEGGQVSIRAPREGGDQPAPTAHMGGKCFNPRPPRRGRLLFHNTRSSSWLQPRIREPMEARRSENRQNEIGAVKELRTNELDRTRTFPDHGPALRVRRRGGYTTSGPSGSILDFAPWCSTRLRHRFPRK